MGGSVHIIKAAAHHCWQQEQWAHAEFYHLMSEFQRAELAAVGHHPWRGIMSPSLLALIRQLEISGAYDPGKLSEPRAKSKTLSVYKNSTYDCEIARRIEARKASS